MTVYNSRTADENIYRLRTKNLTFNENKTKVLSLGRKNLFHSTLKLDNQKFRNS